VYALQANDDELVNNAVEIKLHAKQRAGQMLQEGKKAGQIKTQKDNQPACTGISTSSHPTKYQHRRVFGDHPTWCAKVSSLDIGITRNESSDVARREEGR
jgi:hypothetical protein